MKTRNEKTAKLALLAFTFSLLSGASTVYAQDDALLADTETVLNSEKIDIDGNWRTKAPARKRKLTNKQIIKEARKKSTRNNIQQIAKEIEQIQVSTEQIEDILKKEDSRLANGVDAAFGGGKLTDSVSNQQAAAASVQVAPVAQAPLKPFKVIPSFGVTHISGDRIDFESKISTGLAFEADVHPRFAVGVNLNYTTLDAKEIDNNGYGYNNYNYNQFPQYGYAYANGPYYGNAQRELDYKHLTLEINGKFFVTSQESKVRPYVGLGIGYNRASLKYQDSSEDNARNYPTYGNSNYGDEQFSSNYISGSAMVGTEINFTQTIGFNLDLKYTKGLSSGFGTEKTQTSIYNLDQQKLDNIGKAIEDSNFLSITGGLIIRF